MSSKSSSASEFSRGYTTSQHQHQHQQQQQQQQQQQLLTKRSLSSNSTSASSSSTIRFESAQHQRQGPNDRRRRLNNRSNKDYDSRKIDEHDEMDEDDGEDYDYGNRSSREDDNNRHAMMDSSDMDSSKNYEASEEELDTSSDSDATEEEVLARLGEALRLEELKRETEKKQLRIEQQEERSEIESSVPSDGTTDVEKQTLASRNGAVNDEQSVSVGARLDEHKVSYIEKNQTEMHDSIDIDNGINESDDVRYLISQLQQIKKSSEDGDSSSLQKSLNLDESAILTEKPSPVKHHHNSIQSQINEIDRTVRERIVTEEVWRRNMDAKIEKLQECMIRQSEALESLSRVLNKEIENRLAGESKVQRFMTMLAEKVNSVAESHQNNAKELNEIAVSATGRKSSRRQLQ